MYEIDSGTLAIMRDEARKIAVSVVMPCLNTAERLPHCIANAAATLARIEVNFGLAGGIVIAENGLRDGSQALAVAPGAPVVRIINLGYGAAILDGCREAFGEHMLIGDTDGSDAFLGGVAMIGILVAGNAL